MINSLKKIFKDEAILCIGSQTTHVTIEEKDIGAKLKKIVISELEQNCLVLGLDEARNINHGKKYQKSCRQYLERLQIAFIIKLVMH